MLLVIEGMPNPKVILDVDRASPAHGGIDVVRVTAAGGKMTAVRAGKRYRHNLKPDLAGGYAQNTGRLRAGTR